MIGVEYDSPLPLVPKMKGELILETVLGINPASSKWLDLVVVMMILIAYRICFFAILKFREKVFPIIHMFYTKRTLIHIQKRPSFRRMTPFPSQRYHVHHALSSQEGLNSPLHQKHIQQDAISVSGRSTYCSLTLCQRSIYFNMSDVTLFKLDRLFVACCVREKKNRRDAIILTNEFCFACKWNPSEIHKFSNQLNY